MRSAKKILYGNPMFKTPTEMREFPASNPVTIVIPFTPLLSLYTLRREIIFILICKKVKFFFYTIQPLLCIILDFFLCMRIGK